MSNPGPKTKIHIGAIGAWDIRIMWEVWMHNLQVKKQTLDMPIGETEFDYEELLTCPSCNPAFVSCKPGAGKIIGRNCRDRH